MAHLVLRSNPTNTKIKVLYSEPNSCSYCHNTLVKRFRNERVNWVVPIKKASLFGHKGRDFFLAQSYNNNNTNNSNITITTTTSTSSTDDVVLVENNNSAHFDINYEVKIDGHNNVYSNSNNGDNFEYLANDFGWKVRRLRNNGEEIRNVARVQAKAFHEPSLLFDDFFFEFFQAEVLAGLIYKLKNSPPNRYACLVAEPETNEISNPKEEKLVGVVDVTVLRDQNVMNTLPPDADEYLYISGIAVLANFRRKKIATVLLKACDMLSIVWGFKYLVLRAYENDFGARELYTNAGYKVISSDPPWLTTWIGRKRRVLMIKTSTPQSSFTEP